jgi:RHS repeat-associated protein
MTAVVDARGNAARFTYDRLNRQKEVVDALGNLTYFEFDANGNCTKVVDAKGKATSFYYDAVDQMTCIQDALGSLTYHTYDLGGNRIKTVDPLNQATYFYYDELNRRKGVRDGLGNITYFFYDQVGNQTAVTDPRKYASYFYYDELDRVRCLEDALHNRTYFAYDEVGNRTRVTDPLGRAAYFSYDALNRLFCAADPLGAATYFSCDSVGNLTAVKDARENTVSYAYDELNRLESVTDALGSAEYYAYDANADLRQFTDAAGGVAEYAYDELDRRTQASCPDGSHSYYAYDELSRLTAASDARGWTYFSYDDVSRLTAEAAPDRAATSWGYDSAGRQTTVTSPATTTYYTYDAAGQIIRLRGGASLETTYYGYDAAGDLLRKKLANGCFSYFEYDMANQLTFIKHCLANGRALTYFQYAYDAAGQIIRSRREDATTVYYDYDNAGRLKAETWKNSGGSQIYGFSWDYDAAGNRIYELRGAVESYFTYDAANELTLLHKIPADTWTYFYYDARGNCLDIQESDGTIYFMYNDVNLVESIKYKDGTRNQFWYDAMLRRCAMQDSDGVSYFTWDQNRLNLLCERDTSGNVTAQYIHGYSPVPGIGTCVAAKRVTGGGTYYHYDHFDHRGTVIRRTDNNAAVVGYFEYDAWGNPLRNDETGVGSRFAHQSNWMKLRGESLYLSQKRLYKADIGRFLQRDVVGGLGGGYDYCHNNPVDSVDPTGLLDCQCRGRCNSLEPMNEMLNKYINDVLDEQAWVGVRAAQELENIIGESKLSTRQIFAEIAMRNVYNHLAAEVSWLSHPFWSKSAIEAWIYKVPSDYQSNSGKRYKAQPYAQCIGITCSKGTYCIGSDKIGHFFQQGSMLQEIMRAKGKAYAEAFGNWTEGLFAAPDPHSPFFSKEDLAKFREIDKWLREEKFTFSRGDWGTIKLSKYRNKWGNFEGPNTDLGGLHLAMFGAVASKADVQSNLEGMRFWQKLEDSVFWNKTFNFDICDYVSAEWEE